MYKHILVPTDGSELSREAAGAAVALAKESGARITAFYARQPYPKNLYDDGAPMGSAKPEKFAKLTEQQARRNLGFVIDLCKKAGVKGDRMATISDSPAEAILEAASKAGCDLIFMASRGRHGLSALFLGSETYKVLTYAKIPVLVHH
ncbi:MAG: universal stress protein [Candidatus Accumulibacter phosphatis]|uniref:universal stress protein n=1 Tax=Candidatus Accumulibacter phosphatis TaxID=327160 RepID=UPI001A4989EC|nr:universal stress protein [Candidatus Accumulibacter phosphatis]